MRGAPGTVRRVDQAVRLHVLPHLGEVALRDVSATVLRGYVATLEEECAPRSARKVLMLLSNIFETAIDDKRLARNPMRAKSVRWPKVPAEEREAWPLETALRVRDIINPRYRIAVVVALGCGLRQGEAFGLSPHDEYPAVEVELPWGGPEPEREKRAFPLLLATPHGNALRSNDFNDHAWKPALAKAGVIPMREPGQRWKASRKDGFRVLRHTYASIILEAGESVVTLARWLGHSSPTITLDHYAHFMPEVGGKGARCGRRTARRGA
ncbi:site-specific integrase [Streptomyces sp. NBC_00250]|uniref:tyrosine-type recombinase/integrase n=1 Tax=Streptomyces sp. NBC_00250 TaxID=2903641 RepID=UPI002E2AA8AE|nr:site-specific integrase [Streptomyces sp. NBC_00250]